MDFSGLNKEQRLAAETLDGPVLILAGAGSGKTRALTYRAANLIDHGIKPWNILALTFTNKAAREMKERIVRLIGSEAAENAWISTFHSTCARILRRDIEKLGYQRSFTIYDDEDQNSVIRGILKNLNIDDKFIPVKEIRSKISDSKNRLITPDEWFLQTARDHRASRIHDIMTEYEKRLRNLNALDFDDLLIKTLELMADHPPVLEYYQSRFMYVMVDEYQDTNKAQYELVRLITAKSHNLCVVGDDDQSIYGWRGADIQNILDFEKDYPDAKIIKLEQNYRSTSVILDAANHVIANNLERKDKKLWTLSKEGEKIRIFTAEDERDEAAWITDCVRNLSRNGIKLGDVVILYRTNAQSRVLEDIFMRVGIPYRIFGGQKFYERKEVKDIIAYLRVLVNPSDDVSLRRIINVPKRSIGDNTVAELTDYAAKHNIPLYSTLSEIPETLGNRQKKCITDFFVMMTLLSAMKDTMSLEELVSALIEKTGLREQYSRDNSDESRTRVENIDEFIGAVNEYARMAEDPTLESYLENVALVTDFDSSQDERGYVTMMTLHSAKGLEFENVFIAGMEENVFPSSRSMEDEKRLEEERRLMYVGITRAKKRLYLSRARRRILYNMESFNPESRFVAEIPDQLKENSGLIRYTGGFGQAYSGIRNNNKQSSEWAATRKHSISDQESRTLPETRVLSPGSIGKQKLTFHGVDLNQIPGVQKGFVGSKARENIDSAMNLLFQPGDHVMHRKFGVGTVKEINGHGAAARIMIEFSAYGVKEFALSIAPIFKVED